ncbi:MAG: hypothetical protein ABIJ16_04925 [Bacteroidota bacterium]
MKIQVSFILFFFITLILSAQGEIEEGRVFNRNERSGGLLLNSNGWGLNYRAGFRIDGYRKRLLDFDFVWIKHPKEQKVTNPYYEQKFVFGKLNSFYNLRAGFGRQVEIFSKFDKGGIAIRYLYSGGISIGLLKPIYYEVLLSKPDSGTVISVQKFSSSIHTVTDIYGKSSFFEGIEETLIRPGAFVKVGMNFEYGQNDQVINAIEVGAICDVYLHDIQIMAFNNPGRVFVSLFICFRYGKIYGSIKD